ncbi:MAG: alpha/beta fold hydrolase BchO [Pseudomonadota bacterium]
MTASLYDAPDWGRDGGDWPFREASQFVEIDGRHWHVQRFGKGPAALLIHGTGAATHSWAPLTARLSKRFSVISIDLPGHGFSKPRRGGDASLTSFATSLSRLLVDLKVTPDLMVGHSAGAAIMVQMIANGMVSPRAAVSINGAFMPFPGAAGLVFPAVAKALFLNPLTPYFVAQGAKDTRRVARLIKHTGSQPSDETICHYAMLFSKPRHLAGALGMMAQWDLTKMRHTLSRVDCPMLFLAGAGDRAVKPSEGEEAAALSKDSEFVLLPDLGHLAHEEAPALVDQHIVQFADTAMKLESV